MSIHACILAKFTNCQTFPPVWRTIVLLCTKCHMHLQIHILGGGVQEYVYCQLYHIISFLTAKLVYACQLIIYTLLNCNGWAQKTHKSWQIYQHFWQKLSQDQTFLVTAITKVVCEFLMKLFYPIIKDCQTWRTSKYIILKIYDSVICIE